MYNIKSQIAEEFINDSEIRETMAYARENSNNIELIKSILQKARDCKGISHREAALLLECNDQEIINEIYDIAREIKHKFYGNRIVMFAPLYLSNYCVNGCVYCPYHLKNKHIPYLKDTEISHKELSIKGKITTLNFQPFLDELASRQRPYISTPALIDFINTLGKNKSGSKNAIGRLQFFLNAYKQEISLLGVNPSRLSFVIDDHKGLTRGSTGESAADFYFQSANGEKYLIDAKMYYSEVSYFTALASTNFHNADYALIYLIKNNIWVYARKVDNYSTLYTVDELADSDPWLLEIRFPPSLRLIRFDVTLNASDSQIPEMVAYNFYTKYLK